MTLRSGNLARMIPAKRFAESMLIVAIGFSPVACGGAGNQGGGGGTPPPTGVLGQYVLTGDVQPVHDPSVIRQGNTYYVFGTDIGSPTKGFLLIRCSTNRLNWTLCGHVFDQIPIWVTSQVPGVVGLWAPDISYFNGLYHVYYAGSTFVPMFQSSVWQRIPPSIRQIPATSGSIRAKCWDPPPPTTSMP
jgi:hypothetical protein